MTPSHCLVSQYFLFMNSSKSCKLSEDSHLLVISDIPAFPIIIAADESVQVHSAYPLSVLVPKCPSALSVHLMFKCLLNVFKCALASRMSDQT